jgi:folate-binding protein YgfZ
MTSPWTTLALPAAPAAGADLLPLPSLAVLSLAGPETLKFLQGQTTADFREVEKGRVLPGAVCSLKGRVLFSFLAVPHGADADLVLPADQMEATKTHLGKYAVFNKTTLTDASGRLALLGVTGPRAAALLDRLGLALPAQGGVARGAEGAWAAKALADERYLVALPAHTLATQWPALAAEAVVGHESQWQAADIRAGFATVTAATRDRFQPQELNYPSLEGVSYNKGCYTGQEVVARLYFRGKLKQRLYRLEAVAGGEGQVMAQGAPVGDVVMAAPDGSGVAVLAVVKNVAVREGGLSWGENGPALSICELPYALPADKEE